MNKLLLLGLRVLFAGYSIAVASEWHVTGQGTDTNDGKTLETAFRTLQKTADIVESGDTVTSNNRNANVRWGCNRYPQKQEVVSGPNDLNADPRFVKIARDLREADFHLLPGSAALNNGTDELPQATDLDGVKRPVGDKRDRGAYEQ